MALLTRCYSHFKHYHILTRCYAHISFSPHQVLAPLGADISGSQFLEPDGTFPNHIPNPEHPSAMAAGCQAVLRSSADLGIVFDTDVDRHVCCIAGSTDSTV